MKITRIECIPFETTVDRFQDGKPQPGLRAVQTLTRIVTDDGAEGYCLGGHGHGDQDGLEEQDRAYLTARVAPLLIGQSAFDRERFWHWMWAAKVPEPLLSVIDLALWDLAGRAAGLPVHKLLGGCRDRIRAYASTYPNLGSTEDYAAHALECRRHGYRAYKIHPHYFWDPATKQAVPGRPSHVEWDLRTCRAVREAVGDSMTLMYDPWGTYHTYADAVRVGRELERLDFYWYEHPMPEYRIEPYVRLAQELRIPICSPEIAEGSLYTRAEWILRHASDISRIDVLRGGITGAMKTAALCEAHGVRCEIHMSGFGNLQVLGATSEDVCEYYERGLLAPGVDYDRAPPYLEEPVDRLDGDGFVTVPTAPGLGYRLDWGYIEGHRLPPSGTRS